MSKEAVILGVFITLTAGITIFGCVGLICQAVVKWREAEYYEPKDGT